LEKIYRDFETNLEIPRGFRIPRGFDELYLATLTAAPPSSLATLAAAPPSSLPWVGCAELRSPPEWRGCLCPRSPGKLPVMHRGTPR